MAPWFGPKTIGYGIGPTRWQGWLVCVLAVAVALGAALVVMRVPAVPRWIPLAIMVLDLAGFIGIIAAKTEDD
jgi:L-asparagine transporter-like permease